MMKDWRARVRRLKTETYALYLAARDPRLPWPTRVFVMALVAYAFSPIDLIPDFIPILGYVDDLILIPLGILLALRLIPPEIMQACRAQARIVMTEGKPVSRSAAWVIATIWVCGGLPAYIYLLRLLT